MHSLVVFASGTGTNTRAIIDFFKANEKAKVSLIVSNKQDAGVLDIAHMEGIPTIIVDKESLKDNATITTIKSYNPSLIVLAGFLWKIPDIMIEAFPNIIVNIHPALLPNYGGKGMYGHHVHNAVIDAGERQSGITIHMVNEVYDRGDILLQARCFITDNDNADTLAKKVHHLEHYFFPRTLEFLLQQ